MHRFYSDNNYICGFLTYKWFLQLDFSCVVFPCLLLAYMDQATYLMKHPTVMEKAFYASIPGKLPSASRLTELMPLRIWRWSCQIICLRFFYLWICFVGKTSWVASNSYLFCLLVNILIMVWTLGLYCQILVWYISHYLWLFRWSFLASLCDSYCGCHDCKSGNDLGNIFMYQNGHVPRMLS